MATEPSARLAMICGVVWYGAIQLVGTLVP